MEIVDHWGEEAKRIHNACMKDRATQEAYIAETRNRRTIIDSYLEDKIDRDKAARLLVQHCHYGPQGAVNALNYAFQHRKPA